MRLFLFVRLLTIIKDPCCDLLVGVTGFKICEIAWMQYWVLFAIIKEKKKCTLKLVFKIYPLSTYHLKFYIRKIYFYSCYEKWYFDIDVWDLDINKLVFPYFSVESVEINVKKYWWLVYAWCKGTCCRGELCNDDFNKGYVWIILHSFRMKLVAYSHSYSYIHWIYFQ